ncbi:HNH endonuclease signature motif containing protein [Natrinema sp. SYSU A 869]|uniref:HNH endonuclease signature motif containing protein n=1 Tax=Natrinema sp. SYSU A 869 TaxID=2871694 RepID=UPI001CA43FF5|nr:HNH endonuclease signature motif containing protein [Natrinema sp. SYSU A 869]
MARETFWTEYDKTEYCCPDCDYVGDELEVHHIDGDPFNNDLENLTGLCHQCHVHRHRQEYIEQRLGEMRSEFEALAD